MFQNIDLQIVVFLEFILVIHIVWFKIKNF